MIFDHSTLVDIWYSFLTLCLFIAIIKFDMWITEKTVGRDD